MNSNFKSVMAASFLILGIFVGINYMVDKELGTNWLMLAIFFFIGALLFWLWIMREERNAEEAAEESLDAAEETLKRLEAQAAPAETSAPPKAAAPSAAPQKPVEEAPAPAAKPAVAPPAPASKAKAEPDDLTRIEGVGPKMAEILIAAGVDSYAKLAAMNEDSIVETVRNGGGRKSASMATWAQQAKLAAAGDWDGLAKLQSELSGGRR